MEEGGGTCHSTQRARFIREKAPTSARCKAQFPSRPLFAVCAWRRSAARLGAVHEPCGWFMCTFETPNMTAVIGRNFSSVLSEYDFSLERLGQVVLSVRKVHAGGGIRSAKVNIRHIDPSRCTTPRHRSAHTFLRAHSVSPQTPFCIRRRDRRILSSPFHVRVS